MPAVLHDAPARIDRLIRNRIHIFVLYVIVSLLLTSSESKYRYKTFGDKRQDWNSVYSLTIKIIITYKWTPLIRLTTSGPAPSESYNRTYLIQVKWGNKRKNQFHINCLHYLDILIIRTLLNLIIINKDCIRHALNSLPSFTTRITFLKMINFEILPKMSTISTDFSRNRKGSWAKFKSWDQSGEPLLPTLSLSWTRGRTVPGDDFESYKRLHKTIYVRVSIENCSVHRTSFRRYNGHGCYV